MAEKSVNSIVNELRGNKKFKANIREFCRNDDSDRVMIYNNITENEIELIQEYGFRLQFLMIHSNLVFIRD